MSRVSVSILTRRLSGLVTEEFASPRRVTAFLGFVVCVPRVVVALRQGLVRNYLFGFSTVVVVLLGFPTVFHLALPTAAGQIPASVEETTI